MRSNRRQRDVFANAHRQERALLLAVFRHVANSRVNRGAWRPDDDRFAVQANFSARRLAHAEQTLGRLRTPGADETVEAENLAAAEFKRDIGELRWVGQTVGFKNRLANGDVAFWEDLIDRSTDHQAHELCFRSV